MKGSIRRLWVITGVLGVVAGALAAITLTSADAASTGDTRYTIKTYRPRGSVWISGGGKAMRPGRLSPGNRLIEANDVRRDDGRKGSFVATVMVANTHTVAANRTVGLMRGVYRFADGDIYVEGFVKFSVPSGSGAVVGGTGAYRGARGTFISTETKDVISLLPDH